MSIEPWSNPSAFPVSIGGEDGALVAEFGMTLLDFFAGQALVGLSVSNGYKVNTITIAKDVYDIAESMLAERQRRLAR